MKNFVQDGKTLTLTAAAAVLAGQGMLVGKIFGVAIDDVAANAPGEFQTVGVFDLPTLNTDVVAVGAIGYWDAGNNRLTTTAQGNTRVGVFTEAKAAGIDTGRLKLDASIQ